MEQSPRPHILLGTAVICSPRSSRFSSHFPARAPRAGTAEQRGRDTRGQASPRAPLRFRDVSLQTLGVHTAMPSRAGRCLPRTGLARGRPAGSIPGRGGDARGLRRLPGSVSPSPHSSCLGTGGNAASSFVGNAPHLPPGLIHGPGAGGGRCASGYELQRSHPPSDAADHPRAGAWGRGTPAARAGP